MNRRSTLAWTAGSLLLCVAIVLAWHWVSASGLVSRAFLPSPARTGAALVSGLAGGQMGGDVLATVERMLLGWLLASVAGVALGAAIGVSARARTLLGPTLEFLRPLPASALIPVGIAFFGLTQTMVLGVICFGTLWPMLLATVQGFGAVDPRLHEVARLLHLDRWEVIRKIALPNALPEILSGMRLGLTVALILSVVGEMLAGQQGLGLRILLAARAFRAPDLFAGVILLGVVGLLSNALLTQVEHRLLRWMRSAAPGF
jgi:sulfonate transport system permease protein